MFTKYRLIFNSIINFSKFSFLVLVLVSSSTAIVFRHDKTDADTLQLGKRFSAVCRVLPDGSCTLIAPKWIITAAHVARSIRPGSKIQFGDNKYSVKKVVIHPEGKSERRGRPPKVDMALVELTEPVKNVKPVKIYREKKELGKTLFIVGFGDYGKARTKLKYMDGKRRAVTNKVDDAGPLRIFLKFDEPPNATEFEGVGGPGDSGGPAILEEKGKLFIAGVSSGSMNGKPGQYGVIDVFTRVSSHIDWIEKTMKNVEAKNKTKG